MTDTRTQGPGGRPGSSGDGSNTAEVPKVTGSSGSSAGPAAAPVGASEETVTRSSVHSRLRKRASARSGASSSAAAKPAAPAPVAPAAPVAAAGAAPVSTTKTPSASAPATPTAPSAPPPASSAPAGRSSSRPARPRPRGPRKARLRLTRVDPWSVMKTAFLLSIAFAVVTVVSVTIVWSVLGAAGVWDSVNASVQQVIGGDAAETFDVENYVGMSRVLGFTMLISVVDIILVTAVATLSAFLYNLSAALLGGVEVTLAEDGR